MFKVKNSDGTPFVDIRLFPPEKFVSDTLNEMDEVQKGIRSLQGVTQNILHRDKQ